MSIFKYIIGIPNYKHFFKCQLPLSMIQHTENGNKNLLKHILYTANCFPVYYGTRTQFTLQEAYSLWDMTKP